VCILASKRECHSEEPVHLFQSRNYKLCVSIGATANVLTPVRAVLDTGAGPNLIREDVLPKDWERLLIQDVALPRITNASGKRMPARGVIVLYVQVGGLLKRVRFFVTPGLAVPCILGCGFINLHVKTIHPKERRVELTEGGSVAISNGLDACGAATISERQPTPSTKVRLSRRFVIPPRCEAHVEVTTAVEGLCLLVQHSRTSTGPITLASGVAEIRSHVPFRVRVINPSMRSQILPKGMVIGLASRQPEQIILIDETIANHTSVAPGLPQGEQEPQSGKVIMNGQKVAPQWQDDVKLDHLDSKEKKAVLGMLEPHHSMWDGHLGTVAATPHRIETLQGTKPIHSQPYRAGHRARAAEKEEIDKMLAQGVIEPATGEWASPIVLVPKPDGSLRFCVDYRKLNAITVPDTYPLPRMDECIDSLGDAVVFTTLDCNSGYWQIPVHPADREKTTFTSHFGIYQFLRLPFGLRNAPATFQRAIDIILSGIRWKTCLVYLDDVIVFSSNRDDHLAHVNEALTLLGNAGLSLKLKKCHFFADTVDYLGHVIRPGRLGVAEKNTEALKTARLPKTQTELRSFLGLCNVYRRFVPHFSSIASPLNALLSKGTPPTLGPLSPAAIAAFTALRDRLLSPPILALPRAVGKFCLDTDASNGQLGCCLSQQQPCGKYLPLGYWSRTLNTAEHNYSTTEKECLAIVWAITHLRPYLEGVDFTVRTDHQALRWVMNLSDAQGRLARWRLRLAEFTFTVEYHPGAAHHAADVMSRLPNQPVPSEGIEDELPTCCLEEDSPTPIEEIPVIAVPTLFEHQCLDQVAQGLRVRMLTDPTWDVDHNGVLAQRLPSGEVAVHVPMSLAKNGPCTVVYPVDRDVADLSGGVLAPFATISTAATTTARKDTKVFGRAVLLESPKRILRVPHVHTRSPTTGLALLTEGSRIPLGTETDVESISLDELRREQTMDEDCKRLLATAPRTGLYDLDKDGLLIRIAPSDGSRQTVVPSSLVPRLLYLEHYPAASGHPGAHRMFQTIRRTFFWPKMVEDVYETVRQCDACARNRISERKHTNKLQLFPAKGPLESVAMDILGPLPRTKHGNRFLLVISDRFSKVTKTVPLRTVTALSVARAFCDHWAYAYGPPLSLLTDNGPQFTAKFFLAVCAELGIKKIFTTAYHPQTNGQVERYNRTILASLRAYISKSQDNWDDYTSAVTYAYNCRVHSSLGMPPFELALSRPPPTLSLQAQPREDELTPTTSKQAFLERVKTLRLRASGNLHKAQTRYKRNFDSHVRGKNTDLKEGDEAYVKVEVTEMGRNHKLESLVQGPYKVLENAGHTFRLQIGDEQVRISSDRVTRAPSREVDPVETPSVSSTPSIASALRTPRSLLRSQRPKKTVRFLLPEPEVEREYVVERIIDAQSDNNEQTLYRVRWLGYTPDEDTWEPEGNLPSHFIRRYWRKRLDTERTTTA
jgi:RNase H-like domain found in reverse transcriptase/Reverse transcriptase (RNA-dependent DNA polymerase)/Integrase zinc binding domain/Chromo (CHRromatin Organisation MOdifier) domain/Integrase core domain